MRRKNKERMTVPEQLQKIKDVMCSDYCRYNMEAPKFLEDEYRKMKDYQCRKCPVNDLQIHE